MGNKLVRLAKYCDCFQKPIQYTRKQQEQRKSSKNDTINISQANLNSEPKDFKGNIFDIKTEDNNDYIQNITHAKFCVQNQKQQENIQSQYDSIDDTQIFDITKAKNLIQPCFQYKQMDKEQNFDKLQPPNSKIKIQTKYCLDPPLIKETMRQHEQDNRQDISVPDQIVIQEKNKYFIEEDEAQFYELEAYKNKVKTSHLS